MKKLQRPIKNFKVGDRQLTVEAYPKTKKHERSHFDVLRLTFKDMTGEHSMEIDMTPDEALEVAQVLNAAGRFWLMNYGPYFHEFMKPKRALSRAYDRKEAKKKQKRA